MDKSNVNKINELIQMDIDAVHAYEQAIERVEEPEVRQKLEGFKDDHKRHIDKLSGTVKEMGGEPPRMTPDFKGFVIQGFTALRSVTGTVGALKAMRGNERLTTNKYETAMGWNLPEKTRKLVQTNYEDERRHLDYIDMTLAKMK